MVNIEPPIRPRAVIDQYTHTSGDRHISTDTYAKQHTNTDSHRYSDTRYHANSNCYTSQCSFSTGTRRRHAFRASRRYCTCLEMVSPFTAKGCLFGRFVARRRGTDDLGLAQGNTAHRRHAELSSTEHRSIATGQRGWKRHP
jgi:hypothetical protein